MKVPKVPIEKLRRMFKYFLATFLMYWFIRAPIQYLLIDIMGIYHLMGTFIAGVILTVMGFFVSDTWIWSSEGAGKGGEKSLKGLKTMVDVRLEKTDRPERRFEP